MAPRPWFPAPLLAAALAAATLTSCSDDAPRATGSFPVRLLPEMEPTERDQLLHETFPAAAKDWMVLRRDGDHLVLESAAESPAVRLADDALVLDQGEATLLRFLELAPRQPHTLKIALGAAPDTRAGELCDQVFFSLLQEARDDHTIADIVASRRVRVGEGKWTQPLLSILGKRLHFQRQRPQARWSSAPDLDGFAFASHRLKGTDLPYYHVVYLTAQDREVRLRSFSVHRALEWGARTVAARRGLDAGPTMVKLAGEIYSSVWLPPGSDVELQADVPAGAFAVSLALGQDPGDPAASPVQWQVAVTQVDEDGERGERFELGQGELLRGGEEARFFPQRFPWPEDAHTDAGRWMLSVSIRGEAGVFLGQPMIHGPPRGEPRNLLLISLDTLRADHLGAYGYDRPISPFLDSLAAQSATFANYLAVAPYTLPTHATMFTGLLPPRHGAVSEGDRLNTDAVPYLPRILAQHGYVNAGFTGGGFLSEVFGFPDGFDRYGTFDPIDAVDHDPAILGEPFQSLRARHNLDAALRWLVAHRDERRFLFLHSFIAHGYRPPEVDFAAVDTHPAVTPGLDHQEYLRSRGWDEQPPTPADVEHIVNLYDATIRYGDRALAGFFARLEQEGILDDTIVVVTADHGEEFWEHGSLKHSVTLYDEMLRVPLFIKVPGQPGRRITDATSQADLMPTLLELLGIEIDETLDGHSKATHVLGRPKPGPGTPLWAGIDTKLSCRSSLRHGPYKVVDNDRSTHVRYHAAKPLELYNLAEDPQEKNDLAEGDASRATAMRDNLRALELVLREGAIGSSSAEMTPELLRQMQELGYLK